MERKHFQYPDSHRDNVTDNYHGVIVEDPYRWLEDDRSLQTAAWVAEQNSLTSEYLSGIPFREKIRERLTQLWDYPKDGIPFKKGAWYYFAKNDGLQNQSVIYRSREVGDTAEVFLDPNGLSADGTVALNGLSFSVNGCYCAYSVSGSGSDWAEIRVIETVSNTLLPDTIRWVKFSIPSWSADSEGFYYSAYDAPTQGSEYSGQNRCHKVFYHKLGEGQRDDALIYADPEHPLRYFHGSESRDGRYVFVHASEGTHGAEILYRQAGVRGIFNVLLPGFAYDYEIVYAYGDMVLLMTNRDAPNFRLIAVDLARPHDGPVDVIPEHRDAPLEKVTAVGGYLMATYLENAASAVVQFDMEGRFVRNVVLGVVCVAAGSEHEREHPAPGLDGDVACITTNSECYNVGTFTAAGSGQDGMCRTTGFEREGDRVCMSADLESGGMCTALGFEGSPEDTETFYTVTTYLSPPAVYHYVLKTGLSTLISQPKVAFDAEQYITEQVFFESRDGTRIPMFVTRRHDMQHDGRNTLVMYGYGGFNISHTPTFNPAVIMLLEQGGVFVDVTLRGGGEYGEKWHHAGMLDQKQNVFDDFIAAAEYLIAEGYTSAERLAVMGGSNGGLLVGACMTQRPDLFAVALPQVGVLDMLRYHRFTIGWGWVVEYGSSDDQQQFEYIYKYSPLHNIRSGVCYPATLITTAEHDDRVVPAHSFKFAAMLQQAQGCGRPVLIRVESAAGHGAGKPTSKRIDEQADIYSFIFENTSTDVIM